MHVKLETKVSGKLNWLRVFDKRGNLKHEVGEVPNLLFNAALAGSGEMLPVGLSAITYASTANSYEDMPGTWSQTGNLITRATGSGTFPFSPTHIGNELKWGTGERCHVVSRSSDTEITVSGPARTITGGTLRRYLVNGGDWWGSAIQSAITGAQTAILDHAAGFAEYTCLVNFPSAASAYTLGSLIIGDARIKLPATVAIDAEDQIQCSYSRRETVTNRNQTYEIGAEGVGVPQKHAMLSVVGNGTYVDVTFSAATHFLAGDKLDLRGVITKKVAISSASSTSTTFTINTATAHSLNVGDSVTIETASLAGYNGVHTVATAPTGTQFTIANAANPGAMGAAGTCRLTNPTGYFDTLGLATVASMQSGGTVARITSNIIGPAVEPVNVGGDPGVAVRWRRGDANYWRILTTSSSNAGFVEANIKALVDDSAQAGAGSPNQTSGLTNWTNQNPTSAAYTNDWTVSTAQRWNAGTGTSATRLKQFQFNFNNGGMWVQITLNTPFNKTESQRLTIGYSKQLLRDLP